MWTDAARTASLQARKGSGGSVPSQGEATQGSFRAAAATFNPYAGRPAPRMDGAGQLMNQKAGAMPTGGSATVAPAHGSGVENVARNMDTRPDKDFVGKATTAYAAKGGATDQTDHNTIDNISARYSNASMVGDHTTPPALQKYLN